MAAWPAGVGRCALATTGAVTVLLIDKVGRRFLTVRPQWLSPAVIVLVCFLAFSSSTPATHTLTGIYPADVFPYEIRSPEPDSPPR